MPSPNLSEIITTTLRNRTGALADNVTRNNALLANLKKRGNIKTVDGGRTIVQELEYAENATFTRYSGYETINVSPSDVFSAAEYNYSQAAVAVSISGLEMLQNSGKNALIDLLESRVKNAERTLANNIATDIYSDGTADSGKQIGGLQLLVADTPTSGTVGGISRSTYTFWRNISYSGVTDGGAAVSESNIIKYMVALWVQLVRGTDKPKLIVADNNYWKFYHQALQGIQRIADLGGEASTGFPSLVFMDAQVLLDGGFQGTSTGGCPANHMYFLNTDYLFFRPHKDRNFAPMASERFAVNQDAMVKLIGFAGQLTASNCRLQGVLKA